MKRLFLLLSSLWAVAALAQQPFWVSDESRAIHYPREQYLIGFAVNAGENTASFIEGLKASAKAELIESIQVEVQSEKMNYTSEINGDFNETFVSTTLTFANADISGLKIEYYYDKSKQTGYSFAYADRAMMRDHYKSKISFAVRRMENELRRGKQLEADGKKGQAKGLYEELKPEFEQIALAQSLLMAIGSKEEDLQIEKTFGLKFEVMQAITRMQSAIIVYISSREKNFEKKVSLLEPQLKSLLSKHGCSYTNEPGKADWILSVSAQTREGNEMDGICFSLLDVIVSLVERRTGKEIYNNNFAGIKGGGLNYESAGHKAYSTAINKIGTEIIASIERW